MNTVHLSWGQSSKYKDKLILDNLAYCTSLTNIITQSLDISTNEPSFDKR